GFTGTIAVSFGGQSVPFTVNSDNQITATAPPSSAGTVVVAATSPTGTSVPCVAAEYVYSAPPSPTVTGLSASSGPIAGGTAVTINGSGFTGPVWVFFGNIP